MPEGSHLDIGDATREYYERRAREYDATSWEHPDADAKAIARIRVALSELTSVNTLDIGCGTGFVSRWLPGHVTLLDSSPTMLSIATSRLPQANFIRASVPRLPYPDNSFGRAFTANLYGHLAASERSVLAVEMRRVAAEVIVLEQLATSGSFSEGPEKRPLLDGSEFTIYKCYFTIDRLLEEMGGGEVLRAGPPFAIIRRQSAVRQAV